ncbi:hypothetical protein G647_04271 [Cladophialophora carrionii CBS 160.54]|uniref:Nudix hydrolase domain-containing protein n=1 Tax=Cladophialophora carrionii CBS 160.54 TaxID=1279043 RepID=V9DE15_9EURO|nr:uncharacterized protein G647_04271 [Cladophialophora carrionii CBS 160.54]ETI24901.1 hypothetical protein G647_04271 [Cladophialophora carrionii CBS 160.54]
MSSFILPDWIDNSPKVEVTIPSNVTKDQLLAFRPFKNWLSALRQSIARQHQQQQQRRHDQHDQRRPEGHRQCHDSPYQLHRVTVRSVEWAGPQRILFVLLDTVVQSASDARPLPGIVFLRGGSVAVLMIVRPDDDDDISKRFVVMTQQPRVPAGSLAFCEIPAGMIDDDEDAFVGAAATEIQEETGLTVRREELVDMTELAVAVRDDGNDHLQRAVYPSPGACDEFVALFFCEKVMARRDIERLRGKLTGNRTEGEKIQVRLVEYDHLWREGARDAKTLAAWALYENLVREGVLG